MYSNSFSFKNDSLVPHNYRKQGRGRQQLTIVLERISETPRQIPQARREIIPPMETEPAYLRNMLFAHGVINSWGLSVYSPGLYSSLEARSVSMSFFWSDTDASKMSFVRSLPKHLVASAAFEKACPFHLSSQAPSRTKLGGAELSLLLHLGWNTFLIFKCSTWDFPTEAVQWDQTAHHRKFWSQIARRSSAFWQPLKVIYYHPSPLPKKMIHSVMGKHQR